MSAPSESDLPQAYLPSEQGQHYELIKQAIPDCLIKAAPDRRKALKHTQPRLPDWYAKATSAQRAQIKPLMEAVCESQNQLDKTQSGIQSVQDFGQRLLEAELEALGFSLPVNEICVRLYVPQGNFITGTSGYKVQTFTLLQAALHNFEEPETQPNAFPSPSGFITPPDNLGRYDTYQTNLTVERFTALCRTLDIGGQYQRHIQSFLRPTGVVTEQNLSVDYLTHQKDMLKADVHLARLKGDISQRDLELIQRIIKGEKNITLEDGRQVWYEVPYVAKVKLHGCLVIYLSTKFNYAGEMIVWIPGDPEHPLKFYAAFHMFRNEMVRKLFAPSSLPGVNGLTPYQHFLTRFIERKDLAYYHHRLIKTVTPEPDQPWGAQWRYAEQGKFLLHVREPTLPLNGLQTLEAQPAAIQSENPEIKLTLEFFQDPWTETELWAEWLKGMHNRMLSDARIAAVPTAIADANYRAERLSHYLTIGMVGLNLVAMVVPGLGEVMLVVMAGQLISEVIDGFAEWSEGDTDAAWGYLTDVVENLGMLAIGAGVVHVGLVPVIEKLRSVTLPNGATRLWKPDLKPYKQSLDLPAGFRTNNVGLYELADQQVLPHEGAHYSLKKDPLSGDYRAQHPTQPDAYQPVFRHNGDGVWVHEGEQPSTWEGEKLRRRLGASVEGLSDPELEQIQRVCDVTDDQLRRMYVENEPMPALLRDAIGQYKAQARVKTLIAEIRNGVLTKLAADEAAFFTVRLPGWPSSQFISIVDVEKSLEPIRTYGTGTDEISISLTELMQGKLPERVVDALSERQLQTLLGESVPWPRDARVEEFKQQLARHMEKNSKRLFDSLSVTVLPEHDLNYESIRLIQRVYSRLSVGAVRELLASARPAELALIGQGKIPLRIGQAARKLQRNARLAQAYSGLYLEDLVNVDTEALVLNSVENIPGWHDDLRLEIRVGHYQGELRASYGPESATNRKVLVKTQDEKYETYDEHENALHGSDDLYRSIQHALTDDHRASLSLPHVWQGDELKLKIQQHALPRDQLRTLLKIQPERLPFYVQPMYVSTQQLGYPLSGRGAVSTARILAEQDMQAKYRKLYPTLSEEAVVMALQPFLDVSLEHAQAWLISLEREYRTLDVMLNNWLISPIDGVTPRGEALTESQRLIMRARHKVKSKLLNAWSKTGDKYIDSYGRAGEIIDLDGAALNGVLETLPVLQANFDHVSEVNLNGALVSDGINEFLSLFKNLRGLDLSNNHLTRLPAAISNMPHMEQLSVIRNDIVLTEEAVAQLRGLDRMTFMSFAGNASLGLAPDIAQMPRLDILYLEACGLDRWPTGLFDQPRPRDFVLDLANNPLAHIPDAIPNSDQVRILAHTEVTADVISQDVLARLNQYRESLGLENQQQFFQQGTLGSDIWMGDATAEQQALKQVLWDSVEAEPGSDPFFIEIAKLNRSWAQRSPAFKAAIQAKVWRMLEAIEKDADLRRKLFEMAKAPATCVDAGAQLFSAMGVRVLLHEAYRAPTEALAKRQVYQLAIGRSRLDVLGRIARARIRELEAQGVRPENIDDVEIYLAYTSKLATRLNLPWQTEMLFSEPNVTPEMLDSAYDFVRGLEAGDGLRNQLVEMSFWRKFIERTHSREFDALKAQYDALSEYQGAQTTLFSNGHLSDRQQHALRAEIDMAARVLNIPRADIFYGQPMTDEAYNNRFILLGQDKNALYETLTDQFINSQLQQA